MRSQAREPQHEHGLPQHRRDAIPAAPALRTIRLLGPPAIEGPGGPDDGHRFRSRKSWALLAYLLLGSRAPSRSELAGLLFGETDDPLRALRWCLAEIRRGLGEGSSVGGDPVTVTLPADVRVDAWVVTGGSWADALEQRGLGQELLQGIDVRGAPAFGAWLISERLRAASACEAILHEAAQALAAQGQLDRARDLALRAVAANPLDENHQALLIRLYRLRKDEAAARRQFDAYADLLAEELGAEPGAAAREALDEQVEADQGPADEATTRAALESGAAAIAAGSGRHGAGLLRTAAHLADALPGAHDLAVQARLALGEALIHSVRGLDQEGMSALHEADRLARPLGDVRARTLARAELGYADFLRGRYDRAERWLEDARTWAADDPWLRARIDAYLGSVESDRGDYPRARTLLDEAARLSRLVREPRREAYARAMTGRLHLLRGDLSEAAESLGHAMELAASDHWLALLPLPQALLGEVELARGRVPEARASLEQAFARACQLEDPCWEGFAARGLALVTEAEGAVEGALALLHDGRARCRRHADAYVWLDVYLLDALAEVGRRHHHPETSRWVDAMTDLASRCGMREFTVRALMHAAALRGDSEMEAARLLAASIDNPTLARRLGTPGHGARPRAFPTAPGP